MNRKVAASLAAVATSAALFPLGASSASAEGKSSIYNCWDRTITSNQRSMSVRCNPPGSSYRFQAQCSWYSAGKGGSYWATSSWTRDGSRATVSCGAAYVTGVGRTVYYR